MLGELHGDLYPYRFAPIIHSNTPLPVRRSEMFSTTFDDQDAVEIDVFQGEHQDARENIQIGEFTVVGLSRGRRAIRSLSTCRLIATAFCR